MPPVGVLRGRILSRRRSSTREQQISSGILRADGSRPVHRFDPRPIHAARSRGPHEAEEYPYPSPPRSCLARQVSHGSLSIVRLRQTVTLVHNPLAPGGYWWPRVETMPGGSSGCGGGPPVTLLFLPTGPGTGRRPSGARGFAGCRAPHATHPSRRPRPTRSRGAQTERQVPPGQPLIWHPRPGLTSPHHLPRTTRHTSRHRPPP